MTVGHKAFLTGCWAASLAFTVVLLAWDAITGRKPS